ncbi:MAG: hypothetical protein ACHREM_21000 [Polyangiales bacterium]
MNAPIARLALVACVAAAASCGAPDRFDGRVVHGDQTSFRVGPVPSAWRRIQIEGALLAFEDTQSGGSIDVFARCGRRDDDVPLTSHLQHLLIGFTDRDTKSQATLTLDGREALHTIVDAKLDGVPRSLAVYILKKDNCVYELIYAASPDQLAAGLDGFDAFSRGFQTIGAGLAR